MDSSTICGYEPARHLHDSPEIKPIRIALQNCAPQQRHFHRTKPALRIRIERCCGTFSNMKIFSQIFSLANKRLFRSCFFLQIRKDGGRSSLSAYHRTVNSLASQKIDKSTGISHQKDSLVFHAMLPPQTRHVVQ